jgi:hypothetical protein
VLFTSLLRVLAATRRVLALTYYKLEDILCTTYVGTGCLLLFWSTPVPWVDSWVARVETSERVASLLQPVQTVRTTTDATLQSVVFFKEKAKGIIRHFMICTKGRNTCSGCSQELARHRKTIQLEKELQAIAVDNDKLAPLLQYSS